MKPTRRRRPAVFITAGGAGYLFGLAVKTGADAVYFVDAFSSDNNLQLLS
jgi:hypothetical protein